MLAAKELLYEEQDGEPYRLVVPAGSEVSPEQINALGLKESDKRIDKVRADPSTLGSSTTASSRRARSRIRGPSGLAGRTEPGWRQDRAAAFRVQRREVRCQDS
jgi:hypothetical protein